MSLFADAIAFAVQVHDGALRKGTNTPYIVHPMETAAIAATLTDDPEVLAAALRCSAAEDVRETHCETCPYYVVEDLSGEEAAFFGEKWATCDVDRMELDAAAIIEELSGRGV